MTEIPDHIAKRSKDALNGAKIPGYSDVQNLFEGSVKGVLDKIVLRPDHELREQEVRIKNDVRYVADVMRNSLGEVMSELAVLGTRYDLRTPEDREQFMLVIQAGGVLAVSETGNAQANSDFFEALRGEGPDQVGIV